MGNNNLSGPLPPELGTSTMMKRLLVQDNSLTGSLPAELEKWNQLEAFNVSGNKLTGTIPNEMASGWTSGNDAALGYVGISETLLSGTLPSVLCELGEMLQFECSQHLCGCSCVCSEADLNGTGVAATATPNAGFD